MRIKILGSGCKKCIELAENLRVLKSAIDSSCEISIEKIEDIDTILDYGIINTPGLIIDDQLISSGKSYSVDELKMMVSSKLKP